MFNVENGGTFKVFENKILLITGGTGSFGNAVVRRFLKTDIKEIRIFSRDEKKQDDMRKKYSHSKLKFFIGDVKDLTSIKPAMKGVDYVFHAAALKQVPSCEFYPLEAVKTNILGTSNVIEASIAAKVKKVICLSTDKAVYPVNSMGISKAMMEKVFTSYSRNYTDGDTVICGTRYGNVMASRGSVIPLFTEQILSGKNLTITDPGMTRFLMNLDEAVELVMYAFEHGKPGDLFIQKAPACTVGMLATALQELFNVQDSVKLIGSRHGEKIYETLVSTEEMSVAIDHGAYFKIPVDNRGLNYLLDSNAHVKPFQAVESYTSHNTIRLDIEGIKEKLFELEYIQEMLKKWLSADEYALLLEKYPLSRTKK